MASNTQNILAGIEAGGVGGTSLAWFAPVGTAAPTTATAAPIAAFLDAGYCTDNGLVVKVTESNKDIKAFGSFSPVRTITTESKVEFDVEFLESNTVSLAVYNRKPLTALTATAGVLDFSTGPAAVQHYAAIFDLVDGANHLRAYCPDVEVTGRGNMSIKAGEAVIYPVTLTAYPDTTGSSVYWMYVLAALAG